MCTVTFIARRNGYCLGMNRDEKLTRPVGLPPAQKAIEGRAVLCPSEPMGGTWIALNDSGASFALINWYSVLARAERRRARSDAPYLSRGEVINAVGAADAAEVVSTRLRDLPLGRINPFRLIGIFPVTSEVVEWRWNLERLVRRKAPWQTQQWISSGFDEPTAQRARGREFRRALQHGIIPDLGWLRQVHRSHAPHTGPFSTCMHRSDAATVSYTEIIVSPFVATMRYQAGSPCTDSRSCRQGISSAPSPPYSLALARGRVMRTSRMDRAQSPGSAACKINL